MSTTNPTRRIRLQFLAMGLCSALAAQQPLLPPSPAEIHGALIDRMREAAVTTHWMEDGESFWFIEGAPDNTIVTKVDPAAGTREPLFDVERFRDAFSAATKKEITAAGLPFSDFHFSPGEEDIIFKSGRREYIAKMADYAIAIVPKTLLHGENFIPVDPQPLPPRPLSFGAGERELMSPDGQLMLTVSKNNLFFFRAEDAEVFQLTEDGTPEAGYYIFDALFSPDSTRFVARKIDGAGLPTAPVADLFNARSPVRSILLPPAGFRGAPRGKQRLFFQGPAPGEFTWIGADEPDDSRIEMIGWNPSGSAFYFIRESRDHKTLEIIAADPADGSTRVVMTETSETYVLPAPELDAWRRRFAFVPGGSSFLWISGREASDRLTIASTAGDPIIPLSEAGLSVREIIDIDADSRWVYLTASLRGKAGPELHFFRSPLAGGATEKLTEAAGDHAIKLAPSKEFFIDTHSSPARPPTTEIRTVDGRRNMTLGQSDSAPLSQARWAAPEPIRTKSADGRFDLNGVIFKPFGFDPAARYPLLIKLPESAGLSIAPVSFAAALSEEAQSLAIAGFVVLALDTRGTIGQGRALAEAALGSPGEAAIADIIAALNQLAPSHPYINLKRVGLFGARWGGYLAVRALADHPDRFHAAAAFAPPANPVDLGPLLETTFGDPNANRRVWRSASLVSRAKNIAGDLLIVASQADTTVPLASTLKLNAELVKVAKPIDFVLLPERNDPPSKDALAYAAAARERFFIEKLKP